jgi:serine/threonine protein kinase
LRRLRGHECIISLLDVVQPPSEDLDDFHDLYLAFEYVDTDLYKLIMSPQYLSTEHIQTFLYQMLCGLKYIHSANVIHRDLKPAVSYSNTNKEKFCIWRENLFSDNFFLRCFFIVFLLQNILLNEDCSLKVSRCERISMLHIDELSLTLLIPRSFLFH